MSPAVNSISTWAPALNWAKRAALYPLSLDDFEQMLRTLESIEPAGVFSEVDDVLQEWHRARHAFFEQQQVEYTRLFVNRFGGSPAPPYASFYLNGELLCGDSTPWVLDMYWRVGLDWAPRMGAEMPDHLAVELEFLHALSLGLTAVEPRPPDADCENLWRLFWAEHLALWLPQFCAKLLRNTQTPFYNMLAIFLQNLLRKEIGHE